jgi:hypothetical protein
MSESERTPPEIQLTYEMLTNLKTYRVPKKELDILALCWLRWICAVCLIIFKSNRPLNRLDFLNRLVAYKSRRIAGTTLRDIVN